MFIDVQFNIVNMAPKNQFLLQNKSDNNNNNNVGLQFRGSLKKRQVNLVLCKCPRSNHFLIGKLNSSVMTSF